MGLLEIFKEHLLSLGFDDEKMGDMPNAQALCLSIETYVKESCEGLEEKFNAILKKIEENIDHGK